MRLLTAGLSLVAALNAFVLSAPAWAETSPQKAAMILAAVKAASGGAAWDKVAGWHEKGVHGTTAYDTHLDYRQYGSLFKQTKDGRTRVSGFNGAVVWDQHPDGKVVVSTEHARLADAISTAYGSINGFFFPDRFPARFEYLRAVAEGEHRYDVLRIVPKGGNPFELWIDHATRLVAKLVDRTGKRPVAATFTGYEEVSGLKLATGFTISDGIPADAETVHIGTYELVPVSRAIFDPPPKR